VLSRIVQNGPAEWRDRGHFIGHCLQALRHTWIDHLRQRRRHHGVDALRSVRSLEGEDRIDDAETFVAALQLLEDLASDPSVEAGEQMAQVTVCRHVLEMTEAETAEVVGISVATVKRRQVAFREWAQRWLEPHVSGVAEAVEAIAADARLRNGRRIADVARAVHLGGSDLAAVAAASGRSIAEVRRDLHFFRAWAKAAERQA
jgi:DNA-directed RNA polymerase specialized sigma24 family protein